MTNISNNNYVSFKGLKAPMGHVVDLFDRKEVDVNGDFIPDLSHGEVVERYILAQCPDSLLKRYPLQRRTKDSSFAMESLVEQLKQVMVNVRKSPNQQHVLNLSLGHFRRVPRLPSLDPSTLYQWIQEQADTTVVVQAIDMLKQLALCGVKILIPSGNSGCFRFNLLGSFDGSVVVAATDRQGRPAQYNGDSHFISMYEQGTFPVFKTKEGFDIIGDGHTDVFDVEVSTGQNIIEQFAGKSGSSLLANKQETEALCQAVYLNRSVQEWPSSIKTDFTEKLFPICDLIRQAELHSSVSSFAWWPTLAELHAYAQEGDYIYLNVAKGNPVFVLDLQQKIQFALAHSPVNKAVSVISGSSFATATASGKELRAS